MNDLVVDRSATASKCLHREASRTLPRTADGRLTIAQPLLLPFLMRQDGFHFRRLPDTLGEFDGAIGIAMTMTLGFTVRPLDSLPTPQILETMQAVGRLGACPFIRLVVSGSFDGSNGSIEDRWTAKEAETETIGHFAQRILHVTSSGETSWLGHAEAAPIFADIEAAGSYVGIPNSIAADRFYMLAPLSLPWPLRGAWTSQFPDRRYKLRLPATPLDDMHFGTHLYHMLLCKEPMDSTCDADAESINDIASQATAFFRCAQRHKLLTDFC